MNERNCGWQMGEGKLPICWGCGLVILMAVGTFLLGLLAASIWERRQEAQVRQELRPIARWESDSQAWAINYPRQYHAYRQMEETESRTWYGGGFPRDLLEETPANVILFAGMAFSLDYKQARGHVYSVEDVLNTQRITPKTPATCWTCKTSDVPRLMAELGGGDLLAGVKPFYAKKFHELKPQMQHPIGCLDCHDPATMQLRISRPALIEALRRRGVQPERISHQQMRSLVCAQCHSEYYFGPENYLIFPWDRGLEPAQMEAYYDSLPPEGFADWTHAISGARMVKMQHPDYEMYQTGVHAYRNVACADCHMPYRTEGGQKYTDHHVRSPLLNIAGSCAVCHRWSEKDIQDRVEAIQDRVRSARDRTERVLAAAHLDIAAAVQAGAEQEELQEVRHLVRQAQLRWDYVAAANGMGFHSPQFAVQVLAEAIDLAAECRVQCARILARRGVLGPISYPDTTTKEKAQAVVKAFGKSPLRNFSRNKSRPIPLVVKLRSREEAVPNISLAGFLAWEKNRQ